MGVPKRLTEMQKRFAEYLVFGGPDGPLSKSEAAELAGYSPKRSRVEGSELTNPRLSPLVVQYIGKLHDERLQKHEVNYSKHIAELDRIKQAALKKGSFSSAVNAEVSRGKAAGLYIDRKIIKTGKLEDMSEQELEAKMKQILDDYAPLLNVTPNESELSSSHKKLEKQTSPKSE
jgi:phage terminase small subunit